MSRANGCFFINRIGSSVSRVEHSVFDLGIRDGSPRLVGCEASGCVSGS